MDTNKNDILKMLNKGYKVKCATCHKGYYFPVGKNYNSCTHFQCSKCGEMVIATIKFKIKQHTHS